MAIIVISSESSFPLWGGARLLEGFYNFLLWGFFMIIKKKSKLLAVGASLLLTTIACVDSKNTRSSGSQSVGNAGANLTSYSARSGLDWQTYSISDRYDTDSDGVVETQTTGWLIDRIKAAKARALGTSAANINLDFGVADDASDLDRMIYEDPSGVGGIPYNCAETYAKAEGWAEFNEAISEGRTIDGSTITINRVIEEVLERAGLPRPVQISAAQASALAGADSQAKWDAAMEVLIPSVIVPKKDGAGTEYISASPHCLGCHSMTTTVQNGSNYDIEWHFGRFGGVGGGAIALQDIVDAAGDATATGKDDIRTARDTSANALEAAQDLEDFYDWVDGGGCGSLTDGEALALAAAYDQREGSGEQVDSDGTTVAWGEGDPSSGNTGESAEYTNSSGERVASAWVQRVMGSGSGFSGKYHTVVFVPDATSRDGGTIKEYWTTGDCTESSDTYVKCDGDTPYDTYDGDSSYLTALQSFGVNRGTGHSDQGGGAVTSNKVAVGGFLASALVTGSTSRLDGEVATFDVNTARLLRNDEQFDYATSPSAEITAAEAARDALKVLSGTDELGRSQETYARATIGEDVERYGSAGLLRAPSGWGSEIISGYVADTLITSSPTMTDFVFKASRDSAIQGMYFEMTNLLGGTGTLSICGSAQGQLNGSSLYGTAADGAKWEADVESQYNSSSTGTGTQRCGALTDWTAVMLSTVHNFNANTTEALDPSTISRMNTLDATLGWSTSDTIDMEDGATLHAYKVDVDEITGSERSVLENVLAMKRYLAKYTGVPANTLGWDKTKASSGMDYITSNCGDCHMSNKAHKDPNTGSIDGENIVGFLGSRIYVSNPSAQDAQISAMSGGTYGLGHKLQATASVDIEVSSYLTDGMTAVRAYNAQAASGYGSADCTFDLAEDGGTVIATDGSEFDNHCGSEMLQNLFISSKAVSTCGTTGLCFTTGSMDRNDSAYSSKGYDLDFHNANSSMETIMGGVDGSKAVLAFFQTLGELPKDTWTQNTSTKVAELASRSYDTHRELPIPSLAGVIPKSSISLCGFMNVNQFFDVSYDAGVGGYVRNVDNITVANFNDWDVDLGGYSPQTISLTGFGSGNGGGYTFGTASYAADVQDDFDILSEAGGYSLSNVYNMNSSNAGCRKGELAYDSGIHGALFAAMTATDKQNVAHALAAIAAPQSKDSAGDTYYTAVALCSGNQKKLHLDNGYADDASLTPATSAELATISRHSLCSGGGGGGGY